MPDNEEIQWFYGGSGEAAPISQVASSNQVGKIPHITKIQIPKDVDENTKKFWVNYNLMQKTLIDNGLMESK